MRIKWIWPAVAAILFTATGCLHLASAEKEATTSIPTRIVYVGDQCGHSDTPGEWINDAEQWDTAYRKARREFIAGSKIPIPTLDFDQFAVLRISMGTQPTGGYDLALAQAQARVEKGIAQVCVDWIEPAPDAMVTQAITSPCLLIQISRGNYRQVEVQDQHGTVRCRIGVRQ